MCVVDNYVRESSLGSLSRLVVKGYRTPLAAEDLWTLREEDTSHKIISELEQNWTAECAKLQKWELLIWFDLVLYCYKVWELTKDRFFLKIVSTSWSSRGYILTFSPQYESTTQYISHKCNQKHHFICPSCLIFTGKQHTHVAFHVSSGSYGLLFWHCPVILHTALTIVIVLQPKNQSHFIALWSNVNMVLFELMTQAEHDSAMIAVNWISVCLITRGIRGPKIGLKESLEDIQYHNVESRTLCHFQGLLTWSSALKICR